MAARSVYTWKYFFGSFYVDVDVVVSVFSSLR